MRVDNDLVNAINDNTSHRNAPLHPNITILNISLNVWDLYEFSEKDMTFTMKYNFLLRWLEPRLKFKPNMELVDGDSNGMWFEMGDSNSNADKFKINENHECNSVFQINPEVSNLPQYVWFPDVYIVNQVPVSYKDLNHEHGMVTLYPDGCLIFYKTVTSTMRCRMNLRRLPFDTQYCSVSFQSNSYRPNELKLEWYKVLEFRPEIVKIDDNVTLDGFDITGKFGGQILPGCTLVGRYNLKKGTF